MPLAGDIMITNKWPGHVLMVHTSGGMTTGERGAKVIHGQLIRNFHIVPIAYMKKDNTAYVTGGDFRHFRPPWEQFGNDFVVARTLLEGIVDVRDPAAALDAVEPLVGRSFLERFLRRQGVWIGHDRSRCECESGQV